MGYDSSIYDYIADVQAYALCVCVCASVFAHLVRFPTVKQNPEKYSNRAPSTCFTAARMQIEIQ